LYSDVDASDSLSISMATLTGVYGTLSLNGDVWTYTLNDSTGSEIPTDNYVETFAYTVTDADGATDTATLYIPLTYNANVLTDSSTTGSDGSDLFTATDDTSATFDGGDGMDFIYGNSASDTLSGGDDTDYISGGGGADNINGGDGADYLFGDAGDDYIEGGAGADTIYGGAGGDEIHGGTGNDLIYGGLGDDTIYGDAGGDSIYAGRGDDNVYISSGNDTVTLGAGNDTITIDPNYVESGGTTTVTDYTYGEDSFSLNGISSAKVDLSVDGNDLHLVFSDLPSTTGNAEVILAGVVVNETFSEAVDQTYTGDELNSLINQIIASGTDNN